MLAAAALALLGCARAGASPAEPPPGAAASFSRAEIFFIPWDVVKAAGLSPAMVRQAPESVTVLRAPAQLAELVRVLDLGALRRPASATPVAGDFRLVVDLVRQDGTTESFAADLGRLVRLEDGAFRPIDAGFRARFASKDW
jgi:hypothetical protein